DAGQPDSPSFPTDALPILDGTDSVLVHVSRGSSDRGMEAALTNHVDESTNQRLAADADVVVLRVSKVLVHLTTDELGCLRVLLLDRKSTRLNSSHVKISYA